MRYLYFLLLLNFFCCANGVNGQTVNCPPNIDFEQNSFSNWILYAGTCCPINTTLSGAITNRHTITSGTAVDPYGGFPVVNPAVGLYSLKLGNNSVNSQAERARYYVHVPSGVNNYSLIFRYAVVFQDPGHDPGEQPRFEVKGYDSATGALIPCAQFTFVAGAIPGFSTVIVGGSTIRYKSWTTASINLSGYAGKTVAIDFASGDCDLGQHFGYGYVDINCALFQINAATCSNAPTTTLIAPPGFDVYEWRDSISGGLVATGQSITIATPPVNTTYKVILKPYPGFGCPDTLHTTLKVFGLASTLGADTLICKSDTAKLSALVIGSSPPFTYAWSPATNLSCVNCANPKATPSSNQSYILTITDVNGCVKKDTIDVNVNQGPQLTLAGIDVTCFGFANGNITSIVTGGLLPYTYKWNTTPVKTTPAITLLSPGIYSLEVKDSLGCKIIAADTITQPTALKDTIVRTNVLCFGGATGTATVTASGATPPYTYTWATVPVQTTSTATSLPVGNYIVTIKDANNCTRIDTAKITQPAVLAAAIASHTNVSCYAGSNGATAASVTGGTAPYTYSWNTSPVQTTAAIAGLTAGTYTLTVTDANGCVATISDIITQPTQLVASTAKTDASCYGAANGTAIGTVTGGVPPYTYAWSTTPAQFTAGVTGLAFGTYTLSVIDANLCPVTANAIIGHPASLVTSKTKTDVVCNGANTGSAIILATGGTAPYTHVWNTIPVKSGAVATALGAGTYIVTTTDANSCIKLDTVNIVEPPVLNVVASHTNLTCNNANNGTASVVATGGVAPYVYSWSTIPIQSTTNITNLASGTYTVTVVDNNGCVNAGVVTITQPATLSVTTSKTDASCNGGTNGTSIATAAGGTTPYTYSWNTLPVQTAANATGLAAGTYTVTVKDKENCQTTANVTIGQPAPVSSTTSKTDVSCWGLADGTAAITAGGGTSPYTYSWNTTPVKQTAGINNLAAGTYIATITDAHNCTATNSITITQPAPLITTMSDTYVSCHGGSNGVANVAVSGGNTPYTYSWNTLPVQTTAAATGLKAGSYVVSITDSKACTQKDTAVILEPTLLTATTIVTNVGCYNYTDGTATVIANGGSKPYTYWWNTTPVQTTANAQNLGAGKYTVQVTDAKGCVVSVITDSLHQPEDILVAAEPLTKTCPTTANATARIINIAGGKPPYTYTWNTNPAQTTDTVYNLASGTYTVSITDANGCNKSANIIIENYPLPVVSAGSDVIICPGASTTLSASGANTYTWSPAKSLSCVACTSTVAKPSANTTYTVIGVDGNNCSDTDDVLVTIAEKKGGEVGPDLKVCKGDNIQLHAGGGVAYVWTPQEGVNDNRLPNPVVVTDSNTQYRVVIKENDCFNDTLYQHVTIYERPTVELGPDLAGVPGATLQLKADVTNTTSINWTPAKLLSCYDCYTPLASLEKTITYTAVVTNDSVCFAEDQITIRVACDGSFLFIPNTFTPNGDGRNDRFFVSAQGLNNITLLRVYNRWGEMMFEARDIAPNDEWKGWDGKYKNADLSPDVYVYYLEVNCNGDEKIFLKGDISIIR